MGQSSDSGWMDRRKFMKIGALGATATVAGWKRAAADSQAPALSPEAGDVAYRTLGKTGLKVSVIGVGTMRTTEPAVIQATFDQGVNYLDTARGYMGGNNERIVGKALKGYRDKVYLATKFHARDKEGMQRSIEESLRSLETDYVDVLQFHNLKSKDEVFNEDAKSFAAEMKKQGKARFVGVTAHSNEVEILDAVVQDKFYDMVLVVYNFKSSEALKQAIARAAQAGVGIVAMKTQAGGYKTEELGDISPHQAALKWVLQDTHVHSTIPSMVDLAQVKEDTEVMRMKLSRVDRQILERYGRAIQPYYCYRCGGCDGQCPRCIDIPTVNRCLMYAEGYGDMGLARSTYEELPKAFSAAACGDCSECVVRCVHGLDVAERMHKAQQLFC